ncbi:hypothetical protein GSI_15520 [Ganoderma sinense ZZ0214-1]|uniref:Uncharacterized protein n=1 Tax=Ganoderma sinense ZZ0214-1 TaxID=1077348 RepID=A0A2G8RMT1_9APHY|nr:hypothetical protein GSI_15520 [Ganoderma sinense ZZ0214-1]
MPSSSSSSSLSVSDALTNLSKAATIALNAVQGAHNQVYEEAERARAERDDALRALHDAQLDAKDLEGREERWKAALDKSDLTIKHQTETIAQLRSEVQTWKTQLTRLEESSRQEIDGWKEQYLRAEHERARLSARIEELIAGQLAWNAAAHAYTAPYTPRIGYTEIPEPSTSSSGLTTKRASTSHSRRAPGTPRANGHVPAPDDDDDVPLTSARKPKTNANRNASERRSRAAASPSRAPTARRKEAPAEVPQASGSRATPRTHAGAQPNMPPRTQLIRRVTAVVDVKEEDDDDGEGLDDLDSAASGSVFDPDEHPPVAARSRRRRGSTASGRSKRTRREFDDEDEEDQSADEVDGAHGDDGGDAEDDELLLGPKTQQTRKPPRTPSQGQPATKVPRTGGSARQTASTKKRKLVDGDAGAAGGRPGSAKAVKSR